ncbi:hypothetical protein Tco_0274904, partial [Tanacetum coccineum]
MKSRDFNKDNLMKLFTRHGTDSMIFGHAHIMDFRNYINSILSSPPKVVERETEVTKDTVPTSNNESTKDVQPPVVQVQSQVPNSQPVVAPVSASMPNLKPPKSSILYPSRRNDERRREKAN